MAFVVNYPDLRLAPYWQVTTYFRTGPGISISNIQHSADRRETGCQYSGSSEAATPISKGDPLPDVTQPSGIPVCIGRCLFLGYWILSPVMYLSVTADTFSDNV